MVDNKKQKTDFIFLDLSSRPGDSGGPVFLYDTSGTHLIGINSASNLSKEFAVVYPIHHVKRIVDLAKLIHDSLRKSRENISKKEIK